jgi:hypothetical protein
MEEECINAKVFVVTQGQENDNHRRKLHIEYLNSDSDQNERRIQRINDHEIRIVYSDHLDKKYSFEHIFDHNIERNFIYN